jgi:hypothetical protein
VVGASSQILNPVGWIVVDDRIGSGGCDAKLCIVEALSCDKLGLLAECDRSAERK